MEVAGLALAIAGLAGQAISGITTLKAFFSAYKAADTRVTTLNMELESLKSMLSDIEQLLRQVRHDALAQPEQRNHPYQGPLPRYQLPDGSPSVASSSMGASSGGTTESSLGVLERRMALCTQEVTAWSTASHRLNIGVWSDMRAFSCKIKIATSKDLFDEIANRITAHRQAMGNSISSLTLAALQRNISVSQGMKDKLDGIESTSDALFKSHQSAESSQQQQHSSFKAALAKLDTAHRDSHDEQMDIMRSMADNISSIASQLSGGSWAQNSGRNSPAGGVAAGRASPQLDYSPGLMPLSPGAPYWGPQVYPSLPEANGGPTLSKPLFPAGQDYTALPQPPPSQSSPSFDFNGNSHPSQKPPPAQIWSCSHVLGIDQLSSEASCCLFCALAKKRMSMGTFFLDTVAFGRHLVEDHAFGSCDLDRTYTSATEFSVHVLQYHCGVTSRLGFGWAESNVHLQAFAKRRAPGPFSQMPEVRSARELQPVIEQEASTEALLKTQICHLLQSQGLWPEATVADGDSSTGHEAEDHDIAGIISVLQRLKSSTDANSAQTLYRMAMLVEEATVSELLPKLSCLSLESVEHLRGSEIALGSLADTNVEDDPELFLHGHLVVRPSPWLANCRSCDLSTKMRVAYTSTESFKLHFRMAHGVDESTTMDNLVWNNVETLPLRVNPRWFPRILPNDSFFGRIDRWMLHCFLTSPNWRVLFRTFANPAQCLSCSMGEWSVEILRSWKTDEKGFPEYQIMDPSDGAVNSLDHTDTVASTGGAAEIGLEERDAKRIAYSCKYDKCSERFRTWRQLKSHMRHVHKKELQPQRDGRNGRSAPKHRCDRVNPKTGKPCHTVYSLERDLKRHVDATHNKEKVKCELCTEERAFSRADALTRHYRVVHPDAALPRRR